MAIAFKEWESVCEALGSGQQAILLRKGGIHEGRAGFSFKHERFFLFPSRFHAQAEQVRIPCTVTGGEWEPGEEVPLRYHCDAVWARTLRDWDQVCALAGDHVWDEQLVRSRFDWGEDQSIHCALVRVSRLSEPWMLPYEKGHGGCRTWIDLPEPPADCLASVEPVMSDEDFGALRERVELLLSDCLRR